MTLDGERNGITVHDCVHKECRAFCFMRKYWMYFLYWFCYNLVVDYMRWCNSHKVLHCR